MRGMNEEVTNWARSRSHHCGQQTGIGCKVNAKQKAHGGVRGIERIGSIVLVGFGVQLLVYREKYKVLEEPDVRLGSKIQRKCAN